MENKIINIIAENLNIATEKITRDKEISDIPEWDSLMFLMIISRMTDEVGVSIPIDKALQITTVAEILDYAEGK